MDNSIIMSDGAQIHTTCRKAPAHFNIRFTIVLIVFVLWTLLQAIMPMQFLPFKVVQKANYLKAVLPAFGILVCGLIYLDRLKINNIALPFILFCAFAFCNVCFRVTITGVGGLKYLYQPIMYILWTFCMFVLVPSIFDSLIKVKWLLRLTVFGLFFVVFFSSLWSFFHGFGVAAAFSGSRGGALRYSFVYLTPGYLGGICYSIISGALMLRELSMARWEKILLLLVIFIALWAMVLADSRTYILATMVLFFFYFWYKQGFSKKLSRQLSWIMFFGFVLLFFKILCKLIMHQGYLQHLDYVSSGRFQIWLYSFKNMMLDNIELKLFFGNGTPMANHTQIIGLADGKIVKTFQRFAIDNVYLELLVLHGALGLTLFVWGLFRLIANGNVFSGLKGPGERRLRILMAVAFGSIIGILIAAFFISHFPSVGNNVNSTVLPASLAIIFIIIHYVKLKNKQLSK